MATQLCCKMQIMLVHIASSSKECFFPSQCSKTCGRGVKKRDVYCKSTGSPSVKILPESMCSRDHKPESQQTCVLGRCPKNDRLQWVISAWSEVKCCSYMAYCLPLLLLETLTHTNHLGESKLSNHLKIRFSRQDSSLHSDVVKCTLMSLSGLHWAGFIFQFAHYRTWALWF